MTDTPITPASTDNNTTTSAMHIESRIWQWVGRAIFAAFLLAAVVHMIQMIPVEISYFGDQAETELADAGILADVYVWAEVVLRLILQLTFVLTALLIFSRRSADRIGLLVSIFLVTLGVGGMTFYQYLPNATDFMNEHHLRWGNTLLASTGWASLLAFICMFPDGRFVPSWVRFLLIPGFALVAAWAMPSSASIHPENWQFPLLPMALALVFGVPLLGQVYRYRHVSTKSQRQQTKWVLYGLGIPLAVALVTYTVIGLAPDALVQGSVVYNLLFLATDLAFMALPLSMLVAMMRYRLWDIDLLINRSLVFGAATIGLLILFVADFLIIQAVLNAVLDSNQVGIPIILAAVISTALFNPARKFVQHLIDHHMYHLRYDLNQVAAGQKRPIVKNPGALTGRKLGEYEVLGVIGKGGMGEVYKGFNDGRVVALKILPDDLAHQADFRRRFEREAQTMMTLDHPNIVKTYDYDESGGIHFIALEFIDGQELNQVIRERGRLPLEDVSPYVAGFASALDYAHDAGLVHRDIKPSNVMVRTATDGENMDAVLMDFGIAKIKDAHTMLTGTGVVGTIEYMAPEQIMAAKEVDHRADIYSLGVVVYEMLTGERPFKGSAGQVLFAHLQQPAPDPRDVVPDLPRPAARAIMRALEKDPDARYQSAGEFAAALS